MCFESSGLLVICIPGNGELLLPLSLLLVNGQELKGLLLPLLLLKGQALKGSKGALDTLLLIGGVGMLVEGGEVLLATEEAEGVGDCAGMVGGGWGLLALGLRELGSIVCLGLLVWVLRGIGVAVEEVCCHVWIHDIEVALGPKSVLED